MCVGCSDREYPRLGQMIVDYENPLKKMMEEFVPHGKVGELCLCITWNIKKINKNTIRNKHCKTEASPALTNELVSLIYDPQLDIVGLFFFFLPRAVSVRCAAQSSDGLPQEEPVRGPVEERSAALSHLCPLHYAQSCSVRHCKFGCFFFFFWPGFLNILIY